MADPSMSNDRIRAALSALPDPIALLEGLFAASPVAYQVYRADGQCLVVNQAFRDLFGSEPPPEYNVLRDEIAAEHGLLETLHRAFAGETVHTPPIWYDPRELRQVQVTEGRRVAIESTAFPLFDRDGKVAFVGIAFRDVTAETLTREALEAVIRTTPLAVVVLERDGTVVLWSPGAEAMFGWTAAEAVGQVFPPALPDRLDELHEHLARISSGEVFRAQDITRLRKDGVQLRLSVWSASFKGPEGRVQLVSVLADETERRRAEEELRAGAARLRVLADASRAFAAVGLSPEQTLETVARFISDTLGDPCVASLVRADAEALDAIAIQHPDPRHASLFAAMFERAFRVDEGLPGRVLRTGEPLVIPVHDNANVPASARPETHAYFSAARPHSIAIVPLRLRGRVAGALGIVRERPGPPYGPEDVRLLQDLADRAALAIENAQLYREAREATQLRDEFLGIVSHELRTPLTAILAWTSILRSGPMAPDRVTRAIETIERSAKTQARLISDVLDVSRIISSKLQLELQSFDFVAVVRAALESVQHAADAKGVALRFESAHPEPFYGDPARVQQIVWNLVNNAVKFTPGGGQVEITVARAPDQLELRVSDTGEGIHAEFLPHLFERFRQADSSASRRHGGLGLGLAITRQLVELHGGTIEAQSPGQGAGATFVVRFPISAERAWLATADASPTRSSSSASSEALRGVRVMLVDDENDTREALVLALARAGAEVTAFADAASALRAFAAGPPDVLVSDIGMPDTDGYEFMQQIAAIRARSGTSTPAIALTAYARDADIERARAAGYDLHVPKPVDMNALVERVASLARRG